MTKKKLISLRLSGASLLLISLSILGACTLSACSSGLGGGVFGFDTPESSYEDCSADALVCNKHPGEQCINGKCQRPVGDTRKDCSNDVQVCNSVAGERCVNGTCQIPAPGADCSSDATICDQYPDRECIEGECKIPAPGAACNDDPTVCDKSAGEKCINNECKVPANNCEDPDFQCTGDYVCDPDANGCILKCNDIANVCNGQCCRNGQLCIDGACVDTCADDGSAPCYVDDNKNGVCCEGGNTCISQSCVAKGRACDIPGEQYCVIEEFCDSGNSNSCIRYDSFKDPNKPLCLFKAKKVEMPDLKLAWHQHIDKDGNILTNLPSHKDRDVMMTPIIANLKYDEDSKDVSDIVFITQKGVLWAISGKPWPGLDPNTEKGNARTLWNTMGRYTFVRDSTPAIANVDKDESGKPQIIAQLNSGYIIKLSNEGEKLAQSKQPVKMGWDYGAVAIADLDRDDSAEIIIGGQVFDRNLNHLCTYTEDANRAAISTPADVDASTNNLEIVAGGSVYKFEKKGDGTYDCSEIVSAPGIKRGSTALSAVADVIPTSPGPEIVTVTNEIVYVTDSSGKIIWQQDLPGKGTSTPQRGGAPNIANFDGDESNGLEIGVADAVRYVVLKSDSNYLWQSVTEDHTSSMTGSSVFDFNGDGKADVAYADHNYLYIYDGKGEDNGEGITHVRIKNRSWTVAENPAIADIEQDGHVDLVVASCYQPGDTYGSSSIPIENYPGVRVFSSTKWVGSRSMWNQHSYHITNIHDDLTVPKSEINHWTQPFSNNYRQNAQTTDLRAPNLQVQIVSTFSGNGSCTDDTVAQRDIVFDVINSGAIPVAKDTIKVALFAKKHSDTDYPTSHIEVKVIDHELKPNERYRGVFKWDVPAALQGEDIDIKVHVDPDDEINECVPDDSKNDNIAEVKKVSTKAPNLEPILNSFNVNECTITNKLKVKYTVKNTGGAPAVAGTVVVDFYVYADAESTTPAATVTIKNEIANGGAYEGDVDLPVDSSMFGKPLTVKMVVDPENKVIECSESDNVAETEGNQKPVCYNLG